jgi:hypothetical protein
MGGGARSSRQECAELYRRFGAQAFQQAANASSPEERVEFFRMACGWHKMAAETYALGQWLEEQQLAESQDRDESESQAESRRQSAQRLE